MYLIAGEQTENRLDISAVYNLDFVPQEEIVIQEGDISEIVEPFEFTPQDPNPDMSYTPYYNLLTSKIEYDETPIPPPEATEEQKKIASLETQLTDTQLALCEIFESIGG